MAKVAEGMARVASEIVAGRLARSNLATKIKVATSSRRSDIESFLNNATTARDSATRELADNGRKVVKARHAEVLSMLLGAQTSRRRAGSQRAAEAQKMTRDLQNEMRSTLDAHKASRIRATRDRHLEAVETNSSREGEVKAMLDQFARERVVRQRDRHELAVAQHKQATAFMRDLTNGVEAFRDQLAKDCRDRAAEIRDHLSAYAHDRREGTAIWTGGFHNATVRAAAAPAAKSEATAEPGESLKTHTAAVGGGDGEARRDKAKSPQPSGRQSSRNSGQGGPQGRQGGQAK